MPSIIALLDSGNVNTGPGQDNFWCHFSSPYGHPTVRIHPRKRNLSMDRSHVFRAVVAQLNFCQLPPGAFQVTDDLCDDHIASNRQRMTYCKTVPILFFDQQRGP
ncbi:hypothetical protein [Enterobacter roggenkampii]|uniref:hypothetical protein n=1 Tax=Enterobacter roggenkampii TaxID=1812935 RepID=UPI0014332676|nr:hypothetical protein [Enterobacter roggenkampii]